MRAPRELLIIGTGGFAVEVAQLARQIDPAFQKWHAIHYVAETAETFSQKLPFGRARYLDSDLAHMEDSRDVVLGVGNPQVRRRLASALAERPCFEFPNLIHPSVEIDPEWVRLGRGNIITKGVVFTCDISIGDFNILNLNATVGHNAILGSFNVVNPGTNISGWVSIGDACLLGTGCCILERLSIASEVRIGGGAVLTKSVTENGATWVGVPAGRLR